MAELRAAWPVGRSLSVGGSRCHGRCPGQGPRRGQVLESRLIDSRPPMPGVSSPTSKLHPCSLASRGDRPRRQPAEVACVGPPHPSFPVFLTRYLLCRLAWGDPVGGPPLPNCLALLSVVGTQRSSWSPRCCLCLWVARPNPRSQDPASLKRTTGSQGLGRPGECPQAGFPRPAWGRSCLRPLSAADLSLLLGSPCPS